MEDDVFVGEAASTLRARRFALEEEVAKGASHESGCPSTSPSTSTPGKEQQTAWVRQLSFLYGLMVSSGDGDDGGVRSTDADAKFFRLEALRGMVRDGISSKKLRAVRDDLSAKLGLEVDGSGPGEEEAKATPFGFLEEVFGREGLGALRRRLKGQKMEEELAQRREALAPRARPVQTPSPASSGPSPQQQQKWRPNYLTNAKVLNQGEVEARNFASAQAGSRKRLAPATEAEEQQFAVERWSTKKSSWSPPSPGRGAGDGGDDENEPPTGATMFQSAKQALCSNLSSPSKGKNYAHTMSREKQQLGDKRQRSNTGYSMPRKNQQSNVKSGFVPPYVKKALDATGHQMNNNNNNNNNSSGKQSGHSRGNGHNPKQGGGGANHGDEGEPPFSPKVMEMILDRSPDGEIPEEIMKLDAQLVESVCNDIMERTGVSWSDIVGQEDAKRLVQEMVVWPMLNPNLFKGARSPPKGLLLFGPPGTGKTLIGKAIASNIKATFFNISASSLTSKWIGEGEKMVRTLFGLAGYMQPAVIFIDEIDSILSARKSDGEHEASRRLKTEMLVQIEGCDPSSSERRVLIVGATNRPEELDEAARRRMPKQLYIPLPCEEARKAMVEKGIAEITHSLTDADMAKIVLKTKGYSGSDMKNFIQEACQGPVRDVMLGRNQEDVEMLTAGDLRPMVIKDFVMASRAQKATVSQDEIQRYLDYNSKHGTSYVNDEVNEDDW
ncbi:ATPase family AAA domain-containing protein [Chloropicon primus]|uniref:P-loop-containing nucleoside triphosphate hydrolase n=1 Tax=Chloropicon primus TaxID=1764295 RepID=A0A5B8MXC4_9CHLO|nr:P-loop-containing nucleoside triphosphate hydrolase [Chloropicon primus]UPR03329.1 ATPase family AAA domain-containing protein [Chloropicon primus]|eukprot:QDZ24120.1 P-loop-containing nucleoside triphosphate hydrolase [Chloropicon primus]